VERKTRRICTAFRFFFRRRCADVSRSSRTNGHEVIETFIAGVMYDHRDTVALRCRLRGTVYLRRDPANAHDANAVVVTDAHGDMLGYLPRRIAAQVSPYLNEIKSKIPGVITDLKSDVLRTRIALAVGFLVPASIVPPTSAIDYSCEESPTGKLYVLLECREHRLKSVLDQMQGAGLTVLSWGLNYLQASSGRSYKWYLLLDDGVTKAEVLTVLRAVLGLLPEDEILEDAARTEEQHRLLQIERDKLRGERDRLQAEIDRLQTQKGEQSKHGDDRARERGELIEQIVGSLLPEVTFLNRSIHNIGKIKRPRRLRLLEGLLGDLREIAHQRWPEGSTRVRGAPQWWESRFNAGDRRNGRLYFKREGDPRKVLVSFKNDQKSDVDYLATQ
jgi:HIRAN domain-containing protein